MAEFLAGASGWYDHEPQKSLNQQTASALRLIRVAVKSSAIGLMPCRSPCVLRLEMET